AALAAAAALVPSAAAQSRRGDYLAQDYGRSILRELPPRSTLVMDGGDDTFYSLAFLTFATRLREDAALYDRGGLVFRSPYGADFRLLPAALKEDRRRAVESLWAEDGRLWYSTLNPALLPGWVERPAGLLRRPLRSEAPFPEGDALRETLALPRAPSADLRYRDRALLAFAFFSRGVEALSRRDAEAGVRWLELTARAGGEALWVTGAVSYALAMTGYEANARKDWPAAERAYRAQSELDPGRAEGPLNLGVVLQSEGRFDEAESALREAVRREPRSPRPWETLGSLLWARERWSDCSAAYASAAALPSAAPADEAWSRRAGARAGGAR
ncbi:MAG: tetratricopeptide repeat protein, partial [Elusimicrobiota bacterium]